MDTASPLRLPGRGALPRVEDHLVEAEVTRDEVIGGWRVVASPAPGLLLLAALLPAGCAGPDYEAIFRQSLAREALMCMHPRGVFESAGDFREEGEGVYGGTIHWKGAALENEHTSRVKLKVEDGIAKVYLVEDSAFLPAAHQTCEIPLASGG